MENKNRTEQEERLQNKSGQLRLNGFGRNKTWDMKEGKTRQHLRRTEKSMQSGSPEERLRNLGRELQNSNKKLEQARCKKDFCYCQRRRSGIRTEGKNQRGEAFIPDIFPPAETCKPRTGYSRHGVCKSAVPPRCPERLPKRTFPDPEAGEPELCRREAAFQGGREGFG